MFVWSAEKIAKLTEMRVAGCSATQIAAALGETSRSAVLGKISRMGLPALTSGRRIAWTAPLISELRSLRQKGMSLENISRKMGISETTVRSKLRAIGISTGAPLPAPVHVGNIDPAPRLKTFLAAPVPIAEPITLGESRNVAIIDLHPLECRWATGEDEGRHLFCGMHVRDGRSYCPAHCGMAFRRAA